MRKYLIAALTLVVALGLTAVALAVQTQTATIKFKQKKPGKSTSIDSTFKVADPDNHALGKEGKPTRQISEVDITFPKGTKIQPKSLPVCDETTADKITRLCPAKSKLANGTSTVDGRGGPLGLVQTKLLTYNTSTGLAIVVSKPGTLADGTVLFPKIKKNVLKTQLPSVLANPAIDAYLTDFHLKIPARMGKIGKGKKAKKVPYAATPTKCPKNKKWVIKVKYFFNDGGKPFTTPGTVNKCTPPKKKHKK